MPPPESTSPVLGFVRGASLLTPETVRCPSGLGKGKRDDFPSRRAARRAAGRTYQDFPDLCRGERSCAFRSAAILRHLSKAMTTAQLVLRAGGATDVGQRRTHNEDAVLAREDLDLYLVADGAGGHNAGEVASALCARSLSNYLGATIRASHQSPEFNRFGMPNGARR